MDCARSIPRRFAAAERACPEQGIARALEHLERAVAGANVFPEAEPTAGDKHSVERRITVEIGAMWAGPLKTRGGTKLPSDVPTMWDGRTGYLYINHPAIADQLNYWVGEYPPSAAEQVRAEVIKWYRTQLKMKIAHSEHLRRYMTDDEISQLQTPYALTMGLLGLVQDDYYLCPNIRLKRVA